MRCTKLQAMRRSRRRPSCQTDDSSTSSDDIGTFLKEAKRSRTSLRNVSRGITEQHGKRQAWEDAVVRGQQIRDEIEKETRECSERKRMECGLTDSKRDLSWRGLPFFAFAPKAMDSSFNTRLDTVSIHTGLKKHLRRALATGTSENVLAAIVEFLYRYRDTQEYTNLLQSANPHASCDALFCIVVQTRMQALMEAACVLLRECVVGAKSVTLGPVYLDAFPNMEAVSPVKPRWSLTPRQFLEVLLFYGFSNENDGQPTDIAPAHYDFESNLGRICHLFALCVSLQQNTIWNEPDDMIHAIHAVICIAIDSHMSRFSLWARVVLSHLLYAAPPSALVPLSNLVLETSSDTAHLLEIASLLPPSDTGNRLARCIAHGALQKWFPDKGTEEQMLAALVPYFEGMTVSMRFDPAEAFATVSLTNLLVTSTAPATVAAHHTALYSSWRRMSSMLPLLDASFDSLNNALDTAKSFYHLRYSRRRKE